MKELTKKQIARKLRMQEKRDLAFKDLAWKHAVKDRDNHTCQVCKKPLVGINSQAHHIIPRSFKELRWDLMNGINLCYRHHKIDHFSPHLNALWFTEWLQRNKPEQYEYLIKKLKECNSLIYKPLLTPKSIS